MRQAGAQASAGRRKPLTWRSGLVADTDPAIGRLLGRWLPAEGFSVRLVASGGSLIAGIGENPPDVIVLGDDMPDMPALDIIAQLQAGEAPPLLLLLSDPSEGDIAQALHIGAADCMSKPFLLGELAARLRKLVRQRLIQQGMAPEIRTETLNMDIVRWRISVGGAQIRLSSKEHAVLRTLVEAAGRVVSTEELCLKVWDVAPRPGDSRVRPVVRNLRRKLDLRCGGAVRLLSELQIGYRLVVPNLPRPAGDVTAA